MWAIPNSNNKYLDDFLHEGLVRGHFGFLHDGHVGSDPSAEDKLGPFGHLISSLQRKSINTEPYFDISVGKIGC